MGHHRHPPRLGEGQHLAELGDPAHLGHARLRVADRARVQHRPELESGAGVLPAREVHPRLPLQAREGVEVLRREERLFEPVEIVGLEPGGHLPRLGRGPRAVRIHAERRPVPHRGARRRHLRLPRLVELDGRIAFVERGARLRGDELGVPVLEQARVPGNERRRGGAAEEPPERHPGLLGGEVPQGDVERGQGEQGDAVAAEEVQRLLQLAHEGRDVGRVPADRDRRDGLVDHRPDGGQAVVAERLPPADRAVLGLDPHQQDVERFPRPSAPGRRRAAVVVGDGEGDRLHAGNLHSSHLLFASPDGGCRTFAAGSDVRAPAARADAPNHPRGRSPCPRARPQSTLTGSHPSPPPGRTPSTVHEIRGVRQAKLAMSSG